jgi:hypothetical protein
VAVALTVVVVVLVVDQLIPPLLVVAMADQVEEAHRQAW